MKNGTIVSGTGRPRHLIPLWVFAALAALACSFAPAFAQGSPRTLDEGGLEKVRWYKAPLEYQIIRGPSVREFGGGESQGGYSTSSSSGAAGPQAQPLPNAGFQSYTSGRLSAPAPSVMPNPAPLPPARLGSTVPAHSLTNQSSKPTPPNLPNGASTNLLGRLFKPQQPPAAKITPAQPIRHLLTSQPEKPASHHLVTARPNDRVPTPQVVQRYGDYPTTSSRAGGGMRTTTSVTGTLKRGALLSDK
jgi:hypothetical protein